MNLDKYYFTGKACKHGHTDFRLKANRACVTCTRLKREEYETSSQYVTWKKKNKPLVAKKWRESNRGAVNSFTAKYRAVKLQRTPKWLTEEQVKEIKEFYKMAKELEKVFPWKQEVDHIIPLQGNNVSGLHVPYNLQIIPLNRNRSKGNKHES